MHCSNVICRLRCAELVYKYWAACRPLCGVRRRQVALSRASCVQWSNLLREHSGVVTYVQQSIYFKRDSSSTISIPWDSFIVSTFSKIYWRTPLVTCRWGKAALAVWMKVKQINVQIFYVGYRETATMITYSCNGLLLSLLGQIIKPLTPLCWL